MCPLYPLHFILTYGLIILMLWVCLGESLVLAINKSLALKIRLAVNDTSVNGLDVSEDESVEVTLFMDDLPPDVIGQILQIKEQSEDGLSHVEISPENVPLQYERIVTETSKEQKFNVTGTFLGFSKIKFVVSNGYDRELMESDPVNIKVHRKNRTLDVIFIHVVVLLVLVAFVNMGCAINLDVIKENIKKPIGPAIGLGSQYLFMPLFAYGLGYFLFYSSPELWLGLFISGCAPGGGGSNMWTYLMGGSLDLSITMTLLSTIFAFAFLPMWVFALGPSIYAEGYFGKLPYRNIATLVFGLVIPCGIGLLIRRCSPRTADFMKRMLKPLSIFFIVFILTFGVYAKFYIFSFFTWRVAIAGFCLPFFGFVFGAITSVVLKRKWEDVIAISIETGIQNTGLAIGVLKIALEEFNPLGDIAMVLPVAVATFTPLPLFIALLIKRYRGKRNLKSDMVDPSEGSCVTVATKYEDSPNGSNIGIATKFQTYSGDNNENTKYTGSSNSTDKHRNKNGYKDVLP